MLTNKLKSDMQNAVKAGMEKASSGNKVLKNAAEVAKDVINGAYGVGDERKAKLEAAGYNYAEVQSVVNQLLKGGTAAAAATIASAAASSVEDIAKKVIRGDFGNGQERTDKLIAAGFDPAAVQRKVNELLKG